MLPVQDVQVINGRPMSAHSFTCRYDLLYINHNLGLVKLDEIGYPKNI